MVLSLFGIILVFAITQATGADDPVSPLCPACKDLLPPALSALTSNATTTEIAHVLSGACSLLPPHSRDPCLRVARSLPRGFARGTESLLRKYTVADLCTMLDLCVAECCLFPDVPEQVKLAVTGVAGQVRVSWATLRDGVGSARAQVDVVPPADGAGFNASSATLRTFDSNDTWSYTALGWRGFLHSVTITGLVPGQRYFYLVGDSAGGPGWSQPAFHFVAPPSPGDLPPREAGRQGAGKGGGRAMRVALFGDMGASDVSDNTVERVAALRLTPPGLDLVVHFGDISYADLRSSFWDKFLRKVEPIAAYVPYMTNPGNHESLADFVAYRNRFDHVMPSAPGEQFYAFDHGPVHFLVLNTEGDEDVAADMAPGTAQHSFAARDLARADANRAAVPWIVVVAHRPFYCSAAIGHRIDPGCSEVGPRFLRWFEDLFVKFSVDLVVAGHKHNYESTHVGVQFGKVVGRGPTYVVSGNAGCDEHLQGFTESVPETSRTRIQKYGYTVMDVDRATMSIRHLSSDTGAVLDSFNLTAKGSGNGNGDGEGKGNNV